MENKNIEPSDTPPEIADIIKDIIKDKVVCDIGCGNGDFMVALSKYAKKVIGIEEIEERANKAEDKGFEIYHWNTFFELLPKADVYYSWTRDSMGVYLKAKAEGTKGIFIFGHTVRPSLLNFLAFINPEIRGKEFKIYITKL